jgi:hypothetical protein
MESIALAHFDRAVYNLTSAREYDETVASLPKERAPHHRGYDEDLHHPIAKGERNFGFAVYTGEEYVAVGKKVRSA